MVLMLRLQYGKRREEGRKGAGRIEKEKISHYVKYL